MFHLNQISGFLLTDKGIKLENVYVGMKGFGGSNYLASNLI